MTSSDMSIPDMNVNPLFNHTILIEEDSLVQETTVQKIIAYAEPIFITLAGLALVATALLASHLITLSLPIVLIGVAITIVVVSIVILAVYFERIQQANSENFIRVEKELQKHLDQAKQALENPRAILMNLDEEREKKYRSEEPEEQGLFTREEWENQKHDFEAKKRAREELFQGKRLVLNDRITIGYTKMTEIQMSTVSHHLQKAAALITELTPGNEEQEEMETELQVTLDKLTAACREKSHGYSVEKEKTEEHLKKAQEMLSVIDAASETFSPSHFVQDFNDHLAAVKQSSLYPEYADEFAKIELQFSQQKKDLLLDQIQNSYEKIAQNQNPSERLKLAKAFEKELKTTQNGEIAEPIKWFLCKLEEIKNECKKELIKNWKREGAIHLAAKRQIAENAALLMPSIKFKEGEFPVMLKQDGNDTPLTLQEQIAAAKNLLQLKELIKNWNDYDQEHGWEGMNAFVESSITGDSEKIAHFKDIIMNASFYIKKEVAQGKIDLSREELDLIFKETAEGVVIPRENLFLDDIDSAKNIMVKLIAKSELSDPATVPLETVINLLNIIKENQPDFWAELFDPKDIVFFSILSRLLQHDPEIKAVSELINKGFKSGIIPFQLKKDAALNALYEVIGGEHVLISIDEISTFNAIIEDKELTEEDCNNMMTLLAKIKETPLTDYPPDAIYLFLNKLNQRLHAGTLFPKTPDAKQLSTLAYVIPPIEMMRKAERFEQSSSSQDMTDKIREYFVIIRERFGSTASTQYFANLMEKHRINLAKRRDNLRDDHLFAIDTFSNTLNVLLHSLRSPS